MSNPLHARWYADRMTDASVEIVENVAIARDTWRVRFHCPQIARTVRPGQFVMLRLDGFDDPLIGRPLAVYDVPLSAAGERTAIDVVYLVKGKLTTRLARCTPGQRLVVWGPLGNGFEPTPVDHLVMVAGGIGQTPFLALAKEYLGWQQFGDPVREVERAEQVTLCYGARTSELLAGVEDFERLRMGVNMDIRICTDDGSRGHHGLVTDLVEQILADPPSGTRRIVCCGPERMMAAVSGLASRFGTPCEVSLETPMACGIGICFTCVARVRDASGEWDYKRTCVDGPVFDADKIAW